MTEETDLVAGLEALEDKLAQARASITRRFIGQERVVDLALSALLCGGHGLLIGLPGLGKTRLVETLGTVMGLATNRVQFTPDLLPTDILGVSILDPRTQEFKFKPGPVFTDILLADEINRASPRTQSALLEAMAERQATIDGERRTMDGLFFVIATQNPVEFRGTYPLPEAQMDRFMIRSRLGYVSVEEEVAILSDQIEVHPVETLEPVVSRDDVLTLLEAVKQVRISDELRAYIVEIVAATRQREEVQLAASPRASLALMKTAQAMSLLEDRDFVIPETIQTIASDVVAHRLVVEPEARLSGTDARDIVASILDQVPAPV